VVLDSKYTSDNMVGKGDALLSGTEEPTCRVRC